MSASTSAYGERYLARVGHSGGIHPSRALLDELLRLHVASIPFENVDSFAPAEGRLGVPLDAEPLTRKMLGAVDGGPRRGGYCLEHAALLRIVLPLFGFRVRPVLGRVYVDPTRTPTAKTHNATVVQLDERELLADPGFGGMTPTASLDLDLVRQPQSTPHGNFRVLPMSEAGVDTDLAPDVDVMVQAEIDRDGERHWLNLYALDRGPVVAKDLDAFNWFIATSPNSPFTQRFAAVLAPDDLRITMGTT